MKSTNIKTAAAYIRVSTDRQEELSPDAQKRELKKYAKKNGIIITDFYQDNGISGKKAIKRPDFQRMISLAKSTEHPYDYILVWKFSRFARNQEESIVYKSLLHKNNVDVVSITEPLIEGPFASLIERIIEWMDEYYSIRLACDVTRGMTEKALRGGYQSALPIGYRMNADHIPEIYEPEAQIVRDAYQFCIDGYNLTTIARLLNDAGYRTRRGNRFETRTVLYILQNPFYIGMVRWNRAKHGEYRLNKETDIIIVEALHEPLIPKTDYEKVQSLTAKHIPGITGKRRKATTEFKHYLCGILKCHHCGSNLAYVSGREYTNGKKIYPYFRCWRYIKGMHEGDACNISERRCVDALIDSMQSIVDNGADAFHFKSSPPTSVSSPLLNRHLAALTKLSIKERRIKDAYIDGIDTKEEYAENKQLIQNERAKLEQLIEKEKIASTSCQIASPEELISRISYILELIQDDTVPTVKKHQSLCTILDKMEYYKETDSFEFYYLYS